MNYYIKSDFGKLTEINGEELELGFNAFTSVKSLLNKAILNGDDKIILLDNKTTVDSIHDENISFYSLKDVDYVNDETFKATGSLELITNSIGNAYNFKDVSVVDSYVYNVLGGEKVDSEVENSNGTGKWVDELKSLGKAQVKDSEVGIVAGYATVNVENSYISLVNALNFDMMGEEADLFEGHGYVKDEESSTLTFNEDYTAAKGTITFATTEKSVGSINVKNSQVDYILGYSNVTIDNSYSACVVTNDTSSEKETYTFKTDKYGQVTLNVTENETDTATNTLKVTDSVLDQVYGFNTVTLINTSVSSISNVENEIDNKKFTVIFDSVEEAIDAFSTNDYSYGNITKLESEATNKATGSITIKLDKNANDNIIVGNISNFSKVTANGSEEFFVTIENGIYTNNDSEKEKHDYVKDTHSLTWEVKATGSVTLKDNVYVNGGIYNYEKVAITNGNIDGNIVAYNLNDSYQLSEKYEWLGNEEIINAGAVKIQETYNSDGSYKIVHEAKATGSVTLKDTDVSNGEITGFATVNLSNSSAGSIVGGLNAKYTLTYSDKAGEKYTETIKSANTLTASNSTIGDVSGFATVKLTNSDAGLVCGIAIDKDGCLVPTGNFTYAIDAKTAESDWYFLNEVSNFNNVKIAGLADFKKNNFATVEIENSISGSGTADIQNDVWVRDSVIGFNKVTIKTAQVDGNITANDSLEEAKGSVAITDANVFGEIKGYKTVNATIANIGAIDGLGTKGTSVTLNDADVEGGIDGVQKVTISKECDLGGYKGTAYNDIFTINKGACVELSSSNLSFGAGNDKLVINGTLILNEAINFNDIKLESITGSGMIVGSTDVIDACIKLEGSKSKVNDFIDLGNTSENFKGKDVELADNTQENAAVADWHDNGDCYVLKGWLGKDVDIVDTRDWIKFTADFDGVVNFDGLGASDTIKVNGRALESTSFEVRADLDYIICITRNEENSVSYFATMTENY